MAEAPPRGAQVLLQPGALEDGLRRRRKVLREGEKRLHRRGRRLLVARCLLGGDVVQELLPAGVDVQEVEVAGGLAGVADVLRHPQRAGQLLHLRQQLQPPRQHRVHATRARKVNVRVQLLLAHAEAEEVAGGNVALHDLLEEVVERVVGVRDEQRALLRAVVVQLVHDLHRHVRLASTGRAHHHGQARVRPRADRLHLGGREAHGVDARVVLGVGPRVRGGHRLHLQDPRYRRLRLLRGLRLGLLPLLPALLAAGSLLLLRWRRGGEGDLKGGLGVLLPLADVLHRKLRERLLQVRLVEEGVLEGDGVELVGHVGEVRRGGVAVAEENVVQPLRDGALLVHEVADALQDRLEVVLLGLAAHEQVERLVDVLVPHLHGGVGVQLVLRRVQRHRHRAHGPLGGGPVLLPHLAREVVHQLARLVPDLHHLRPAHVPASAAQGRSKGEQQRH
eukprot:392216-Prorocentrum_minimum.AAC.1